MTSGANAGPVWQQFDEAAGSPDDRRVLLPEFIGGALLVVEALSFG